MNDKAIHIAFYWHMHQPIYTEPNSSVAAMPWTRLHATKDYLDMPLWCEETGFPATFNIVPSLMEQLQGYASGSLTDRHLELSRKPVHDLTSEERASILSSFFAANEKRMIARLPRFLALQKKYGGASDYSMSANLVPDRDILDLTVLFHLAWCGEHLREDPVIAEAVSRGSDFSEEDRERILAKTMEWIGGILPTYKRMWDSGLIEITMSPYYHPILPLLCRTDIAAEAHPGSSLPAGKMAFSEDAKRQIDLGLRKFHEVFRREPSGMWPSEGSVSEDILPLLADTPIRWIATDEAILMKSIDADVRGINRSATLYRPHFIERDGRRTNIVFRDCGLSDKIGFKYAEASARDAVDDFIADLKRIRDELPDDGNEYLVSIILDGENAWEFYPQNGREFFLELYSRLMAESWIEPTTIGRFVEEYSSAPELRRISPGSWIDGDFGTWIGEDEKDRAWDELIKARRAMERFREKGDLFDRAMQDMLVAEGSDWFWWFGEHSADTAILDRLFRERLTAVYRSLGIEAPASLGEPISKGSGVRLVRRPSQFISPKIDGKSNNYFEWQTAGEYDRRGFFGAMHGETIASELKRIFFGFDGKSVFVRIDTESSAREIIESGSIIGLEISDGSRKRVSIRRTDKGIKAVCSVFDSDKNEWKPIEANVRVAADDVVELAIPIGFFGIVSGERMAFYAFTERNGEIEERLPMNGSIEIQLPDDDFDSENWIV